MKKIIFITNRYSPDVVGGAELTVQTLAEELAQRGIVVYVITLAAAGAASEQMNGIRVYRLIITNVYAPFGGKQSAIRRLTWHLRDLYNADAASQVANLLDEVGPDIVSTHNIGGMGIAIWDEIRARGIKLVHTLHDYYMLCPKVTMFKNGENCDSQCATCLAFSFPKRLASSNVDVVVGISKFILDAHLSRGYFPKAKSVVIHNSRVQPTQAMTWAPDEDHRAPLKLGFIGRLERAKGIELLLSALSSFERGSWTLTVAGKPSSEAYLAHLREAYPLSGVVYRGFMTPGDFYSLIDVLVVPSLWNEPLGVVAFESMGYGRPVITSNRGGLPEVLGKSGAGWVFDAGDQSNLVTILGEVIHCRGKLSEVRAASLARRKYFDPARHANEFLNALGE